jgi:two-component sensor histidine kinase
MILHEHLTNSVKHGALTAGCRIEIEWRHATGSDPMLEVMWQEVGGPAATAPQKPGFGLRLIETSVRHELRGSLESSYRPEGVGHRFRIPWQGH